MVREGYMRSPLYVHISHMHVCQWAMVRGGGRVTRVGFWWHTCQPRTCTLEKADGVVALPIAEVQTCLDFCDSSVDKIYDT
jgi:hypothetical protein